MDSRLWLRAGLAPLVLVAAIGAGEVEVSAGEASPARTRAEAAARLSRRVTADLRSQSLRDSVEYLCATGGLECAAFWADADGPGLDPEAMVSVQLRNTTIEEAIDRLLGSLVVDFEDAPTWQLSTAGALEVGPRSWLNRHHRTEVYPIADLVRETPDFKGAPTIDLSAALGADGGTIFREDESGSVVPAPKEAETPADQVVSLITRLVEPTQWAANGGEGASIHVFRDVLVIDAPEYIHRQIGLAPRD